MERRKLTYRLLGTGLTIIALLLAYLAWDYFPPGRIPLVPATCKGLACLRASKLVVQELDRDGQMWATRGLWAYSRQQDANEFVRRYHIPTGANLAWLNNFSLVRWLTSRDNSVELVNLPDGGVMAQSGPFIWLRRGAAGRWQKSHMLAHYGLSVGRGLMPSGIASLRDGTLLYGEYWRNPARGAANIYRYRAAGIKWEVAYTFGDRQIRHVHAVQADPYEAKAWISTGDGSGEPMLAWTEDGATSLHIVGRGEASNAGQKWRTCQLVFTPDRLYWGADTDSLESGIYRYERSTGSLSNLTYVPGAIWFGTRLADGLIVMSSAVEGFSNEVDKIARLWLVNTNEEVRCLPLTSSVRPKFFDGYALLRLPHNQGAKDLYLTCLNVADLNGDLLVVRPETLKTASTPWPYNVSRRAAR